MLRYGERTTSGAAGGRIGVAAGCPGIVVGAVWPGVATCGSLPWPARGRSASAVRLGAAEALEAATSPPPTAAAVAPDACRKRRRSIVVPVPSADPSSGVA